MAAKKGVDFIKTVADFMVKENTFDRFLQKVRITGGGDGAVKAELKLGPEHINLHGGIHGGVVAALLDNLTTYAVMSKTTNHPGETVDMQVMFLKAPRLNDELLLDANTVRLQDNLAFLELEIRNKKDGTMVAKGTQTKFIDTNQTLNVQ